MTTPAQVFDYDMETRARTLRKTQEVPSGHNPADYVTRRLLCAGRRRRDGAGVAALPQGHAARRLGAAVPLRLRRLRHLHPGLRSRPTRLSLVDRGFIFAIAHIRGGKDKGYRWYTDGKLREEAQHLHRLHRRRRVSSSQQGYTRRGRIVANGGSAGGMLMGVVANMAPDLFLGIIADVPFVDVLNTMLDEDLPLTPPEWPEWGNPIAVARRTSRSSAPTRPTTTSRPRPIRTSSPTAASPTRASPTGSRPSGSRGCASSTPADNLILLKTNMEAGHGGASGRFEELKEMALDYAFALKIAGQGEA